MLKLTPVERSALRAAINSFHALGAAERQAARPHVLRLLIDELEIAMALTGCATPAQASRALLEFSEFQSPQGSTNIANAMDSHL